MLAFSHSSREIAAVMMHVFGKGNAQERFTQGHLTNDEKDRVATAVERLKFLDPAVVAKVACALLRYDSHLAAQMLQMLEAESQRNRAC